MRLIHTSESETMNIVPDGPGLLGGAVICFSNWHDHSEDDEVRRGAYVTGFSSGKGFFVHELICTGTFIETAGLIPDEQADEELRRFFSRPRRHCDIYGCLLDDFTPEQILDGSCERRVDRIEDAGWFIQRIRAQVARRAGYLGVMDQDEQGCVYIIDFEGTDLNSGWRCLGRHGDWADDLDLDPEPEDDVNEP